MDLSPSTEELIAEAHRVVAGFNVRMRHAVASLPGNPGRVSIATFGSMWATRCDLPGAPDWMSILGPLGESDLGALPEALAWYGSCRPRIEVTPRAEYGRVALALARNGAVLTFHYDVLRGRVAVAAAEPHGEHGAGVDIVRVGPDNAALFGRTLLAGHVDEFYEHEAQGLASLACEPGVTAYLALLDGEPAAAAMLSVADGVAYLANASTLPAHRNRGCQSALLRARLGDAARAGCSVVLGAAAGGSTSHRNMERVGLHTLFTIDTWTFPPDYGGPAAPSDGGAGANEADGGGITGAGAAGSA